jgi:hypothetical protein
MLYRRGKSNKVRVGFYQDKSSVLHSTELDLHLQKSWLRGEDTKRACVQSIQRQSKKRKKLVSKSHIFSRPTLYFKLLCTTSRDLSLWWW